MTPSPVPPPWRFFLLLGLAVLLPAGLVVGLPYVPPGGAPPAVEAVAVTAPTPSLLPLVQTTTGPEPGYRPLITNVQIVDFDRDGIPDVIACDARRGRVIWYRQAPRGHWEERILGDLDLASPAHATIVDLD